jgi:hypothetical protein
MKRLGYYAKNQVTGNLHEYETYWWMEDDVFMVKDMLGNWVKEDPSKYEVLEIGFFTADGYNDDPNVIMHIDDDEWEKEMGR